VICCEDFRVFRGHHIDIDTGFRIPIAGSYERVAVLSSDEE